MDYLEELLELFPQCEAVYNLNSGKLDVSEKYRRLKIRRRFLTIDGDMVKISFELKRELLTKMGGSFIGSPFTWNAAKRAEYFDTLPNSL